MQIPSALQRSKVSSWGIQETLLWVHGGGDVAVLPVLTSHDQHHGPNKLTSNTPVPFYPASTKEGKTWRQSHHGAKVIHSFWLTVVIAKLLLGAFLVIFLFLGAARILKPTSPSMKSRPQENLCGSSGSLNWLVSFRGFQTVQVSLSHKVLVPVMFVHTHVVLALASWLFNGSPWRTLNY